eukprot:NODE_7946_length_379_cov_24.693939_g6231_i0.p2 GENE.NODE_7946_length_379_cov_24.693939_g6231_i0~~NODE_7946_length_379_cov_24.693939_g6231_i0.p2  ORF type:complete len:79 (-),score=5.34 NODE_7946_length_379_cov_24.693939_g6231_i0:113-349(-)
MGVSLSPSASFPTPSLFRSFPLETLPIWRHCPLIFVVSFTYYNVQLASSLSLTPTVTLGGYSLRARRAHRFPNGGYPG